MVESGNILRTEVHKLIKPGGRIVLDLTNVTHCDSMGLGSVISLYVFDLAPKLSLTADGIAADYAMRRDKKCGL